MNRRLPRFALLVVLLVSAVGMFTIGDGSQTRVSLAQEDQCASLAAAPIPGVVTHELVLEGTGNHAKVQTVELAVGETVPVHTTYDPLVVVEDGSVTLTVCTGDTVAVTPGPTGPFELVTGPTTKDLVSGNTVTGATGGIFYLTGSSTDSSKSHITVLYTKSPITPVAICGGAGC